MCSFGFCVETSNSLQLPFELGDPPTASIDFSEATKLKEVVFRLTTDRLPVTWIITALQTITSKHRDLRQISIHVRHASFPIADPANVRKIVGEVSYIQWMDLDRLLVQFWESRTVRPRIVYYAAEGQKEAMWECIGSLLPQITERGIIELVDLVEL